MKGFKLNTKILIICCALLSAYGISTLEKRIGSDRREYLIEFDYEYTWIKAWHECDRRNRQLLTIYSAEKQNVINELFEMEGNHFFWLGANNDFNTSNDTDRLIFFWTASGKQFTYANWKEAYPRLIDNSPQCVQIDAFDKKWRNWGCHDRSGFICEDKPLGESSNETPNNASDIVQEFIKDFNLKFLHFLKDNMDQLSEQFVNKLANVAQTAVEKILNKQELSTMELNHEIPKQGNDFNDQLKRIADERNVVTNEILPLLLKILCSLTKLSDNMATIQPDIHSNCDKKQ